MRRTVRLALESCGGTDSRSLSLESSGSHWKRWKVVNNTTTEVYLRCRGVSEPHVQTKLKLAVRRVTLFTSETIIKKGQFTGTTVTLRMNPCISLIPALSVDLHTRKKYISSSSGHRLWKAGFHFWRKHEDSERVSQDVSLTNNINLDPRAQSPIAQLFRLLLCYIPIPKRRQCAWRPIMMHRACSLDRITG